MEHTSNNEEYINRIRAKDYIKFYIESGYSEEIAIRRGWEEAYEELLETCLKLRDRINVLEKKIIN